MYPGLTLSQAAKGNFELQTLLPKNWGILSMYYRVWFTQLVGIEPMVSFVLGEGSDH